jgi:capsular exopolysaccharide synthesis family protein
MQAQEQQELQIKLIDSALSNSDFAALAALIGPNEVQMARKRGELVDILRKVSDRNESEQVRRKLDSLDVEIEAAANRRISEINASIASNQEELTQIRATLERALNEEQIPNAAAELYRLQRESETSRSLFNTYLGKLRELEQQKSLNNTNSRVVSLPELPDQASFPPFGLIGIGGLVFALGAGIGVALIRDQLVRGFTTGEQLEAATGLPVLALIPRLQGRKAAGNVSRAMLEKPLSEFTESVRRIRSALEPAGSKGHLRIVVTSSVPREGKTTLALSLARAFALSGRSTLLIDADLRSPEIHAYAGRRASGCLNEYLESRRSAAVDSIDIAYEPETGLSYIFSETANSIIVDRLLTSDRFRALLDHASSRFDVVIMDTPPLGLVVDAEIVARQADCLLFVVRYASSSEEIVISNLKDFRRRNDLPVWLVFNAVGKEIRSI